MAKVEKTRIYELPDVQSGYIMVDGGPGVECGKLHTDELKGQVLSNLAPEYEETKSYQKADWCVHDGNLYTANTDITYDGTNPNQWDDTKWIHKEFVDNIPVLTAIYNSSTDKYDVVGDAPDLNNTAIAILRVYSHMTHRWLVAIGSDVGYGYFAFHVSEYSHPGFVWSHEWNCLLNSSSSLNYYTYQYKLTENIGTEWVDTHSYVVGDTCTYNGLLYRCIAPDSAGTSERAWDPSHWEHVTVTDLLDSIDSVIPSTASSSNQLVTQADMSVFSGSTPGLVPAATSGDADKVLKGDGTWGSVASGVSITYDSVNEELHLDFSA